MEKPTITVIVPALNEERGLEVTARTLSTLLPRYFSDWEIFIWNDGSDDATYQIAKALAEKDPHVRDYHHLRPRNLGACYKGGLQVATKEYVILVPGDSECGSAVLESIFAHVGAADIIIPYPVNAGTRSRFRRSLSATFTWLLNRISRCHVRYYNGPVLHRTTLARSCVIHTDGFGYQAELLVKLLRRGHGCREVPIELSPRRGGRSKAFRPRNILAIAVFLLRLLGDRTGRPVPNP
jgi:dolichol-phosphate mannosyltransferase